MSSRHQNPENGFIFAVLFGAFIFSQPLMAGGEDRAYASLWRYSASSFPSTGPAYLNFSFRDLSLLKKGRFWNSQIPEMEPVDNYGSFFGLKITIRLQGGWNAFAGGDVEKGISGLYDNAVAAISASDLPIMQNRRETSHAGLEAGGDLIYCITPRLGIGIGVAKVKAGKDSHVAFQQPSYGPDNLRMWPEIRVTSLRAGLFYSFPFAGWLGISVHGGPALYSAKYSCSMGIESGGYSAVLVQHGLINTGYYQKARAKQMGFEGGVGFEFNPNPYFAIFVEAQGRYARISGFEGEEETGFYRMAQYQRSVKKGSVYIGRETVYPQLDIIPPESTVPGSARKATLDFSGVSFLAGIKLRF